MNFLFLIFIRNIVAFAHSKVRRSSSLFSLDGDEDVNALDEILATLTNGTVDEIEAEIMANMDSFGLGRRQKTTPLQEKKFRNLKILVIWLQKDGKFGKYCYYGCHCLPEGSHDIAQGGYGTPKDEIDSSCRRFGQCYKCLIDEHADDDFDINGITECKGEEIGYAVDLVEGENGRSIQCLNKLGSCRRNICECDKQLAENLAMYQDEWDEQFHSRRGGFDRNTCRSQERQMKSSPKFEYCCGNRQSFPLNEPKNSAQCCDGPKSLPNGQC